MIRQPANVYQVDIDASVLAAYAEGRLDAATAAQVRERLLGEPRGRLVLELLGRNQGLWRRALASQALPGVPERLNSHIDALIAAYRAKAD